MDIFEEIVAAKKANYPAVVATVIEAVGSAPGRPGARMLVRDDGSTVGTIGGGAIEKRITDEAKELIRTGDTKFVRYKLEDLGMSCGGEMAVFLEPLRQAPPLIIFGAGHIGSVLSQVGKMLDFAVTVVDNRPEFATQEKLPQADQVVCDDYDKALNQLTFSDASYIVILTHRHAHDMEILEYCARRPFRYLGMIGSRNKVAKTFAKLREKGVDEETISRITAPIGINLGGNAPAEIAVAIGAELVAVRSDADVEALRSANQKK
jgi:xanthine dehydrogenase accessory factor